MSATRDCGSLAHSLRILGLAIRGNGTLDESGRRILLCPCVTLAAQADPDAAALLLSHLVLGPLRNDEIAHARHRRLGSRRYATLCSLAAPVTLAQVHEPLALAYRKDGRLLHVIHVV